MSPQRIRHRQAIVASAVALSAAVSAPGAAWAAAAPLAASARTSSASTPTPSTTYRLALPQLAAFAAGRELLEYVVSCALPVGVELAAAGSRFGGALGLAPGWLHAAPDKREQRLVSACLLARTNFFGRPVEISMRSAQADAAAGLRADDDERARFARREAGFFGNLFATPAVTYVCAGDSREGRTGWLEGLGRICSLPARGSVGGVGDARIGSPTICGFTYVGVCSARPFVQAGIDYSEAVIDVYLPPVPSQSAAGSCSACAPLDQLSLE